MKMTSRSDAGNNNGFTIIELMIAITAISLIVLLSTVVVTNIGNLYYKGISKSRAQENLRAIADEISQQIKFSGSAVVHTVTGGTEAYCIGTLRYTFAKNVFLTSSQHVLWRDTLASASAPCIPQNLSLPTPTAGGVELMAPQSELTEFTIAPSAIPNAWDVNISVALGGDATLLTGSGYDTTCAGGAGDRFCATARLSTTVMERV